MMSLPSFETFFSFSLELISKSTALENKMKGDFKYALKRRKKKDHVSPYQQKDSLLKDISYKKRKFRNVYYKCGTPKLARIMLTTLNSPSPKTKPLLKIIKLTFPLSTREL